MGGCEDCTGVAHCNAQELCSVAGFLFSIHQCCSIGLARGEVGHAGLLLIELAAKVAAAWKSCTFWWVGVDFDKEKKLTKILLYVAVLGSGRSGARY